MSKAKKQILTSFLLILTLCAGTAAAAGAAENSAFKEYESVLENSPASVMHAYNDAVEAAEAENDALDALIGQAWDLLNAGTTAYNEETRISLAAAAFNAISAKEEVPESLPVDALAWEGIPALSVLDDEDARTTVLDNPPSTPDYTDVTDALTAAISDFEKSVQIYDNINNPTEEFVEERLAEISTVTGTLPATEPTGSNAPVCAVYFNDSRVSSDKEKVSENVYGGGAVELCGTAEAAEERDLYLATFDGAAFTRGYHTVLGSMVIRTSPDLTTGQQEKMAEQIIAVLTEPAN